MTEEYILSKGYKEYSPTQFHSDSVVKFFQKRFDDEKGKKYFINVEKYDFTKYYKNGQIDYIPIGYEYTIQLFDQQERCIDIRFHSDWNLDDVEDFVEKQWQLGLYKYYETWSENNV